jgi:hypothetical protein
VKPTPAHYAAARAKFYALRDSGKSPTADPQRYWEGVTDAVLALVPEPLAGIRVRYDARIPEGEVHLRSTDQLVRITGIETSPAKKKTRSKKA